VLFLDGDVIDSPEFMNQLVDPIQAGTDDFVIGSRTRVKRETGSMNFQQIFAGRLAGWLMSILDGVRYTDMCPFRAIRKSSFDSLGMREMTYGWNLEMQMRVAALRLRIREVPAGQRRRQAGVSKVSGRVGTSLKAASRIGLTFVRVAFTRSAS